ncbi:AzlD domain-containing protein [Streptomyces sp. NPDC056683]|uniref:AzlD domain-containing protein n=1 Tax=Streptomyces sp. NPDC056683 TaxID=3345910 RepID=UPI0036B3F1E5
MSRRTPEGLDDSRVAAKSARSDATVGPSPARITWTPDTGGSTSALHGRVEIPARVQEPASAGAVVLLVALLATGALTEGGGLAGIARPAGVLAAGVLAWRGAPFAVVVLGAAAVTALLRAAGVG